MMLGLGYRHVHFNYSYMRLSTIAMLELRLDKSEYYRRLPKRCMRRLLLNLGLGLAMYFGKLHARFKFGAKPLSVVPR